MCLSEFAFLTKCCEIAKDPEILLLVIIVGKKWEPRSQVSENYVPKGHITFSNYAGYKRSRGLCLTCG